MSSEIATGIAPSRSVAPLLWLLLATSSFVVVEPAPYDILLIGLMAALLLTGLKVPRELGPVAWCLGIFAFANVVAAAVSSEPTGTLRSTSIRIYMVLACVFFASVLASRPDRHLPALWSGYLVAGIVAVGWGALELFDLVGNPFLPPDARARGFFKDPNVYAPFLVPLMLYSLYRMGGAGARAPAWFGLFLFFAFGLLIGFSRGAWLNGMLSLALYGALAFMTAKRLRSQISWILLSVVVLFCVVLLVVGAVSTRSIAEMFFQRAVLFQDYDLAEGGRFATQLKAIQAAAASPLGVGPGLSDEVFGLEPHNLYLHVLVEGGWLAALAFYGFVLLTLSRALELVRHDSPWRGQAFVVVAALCGMLAQSLFIDSTHWRHLWLLFAMVWAMWVAMRRWRGAASRIYVTKALKSGN